MSSIISDLSILLNAFGIGLGLFWSYVLITKKNSSHSDFFLSSLLVLFAILMGNTIVQLSGYGAIIQGYQKVANILTFLIGPLLLGYTLSQTRDSQKWIRRFYLHLIPVLFLFPLLLPNRLFPKSEHIELWINYIWNFQIVIYLLLIYKNLKDQHQWRSLPALIYIVFVPIWAINFVLFLVKNHVLLVPDYIFLNVTLLFFTPIIIVAFRTLRGADIEKEESIPFALEDKHYQDYSIRITKIMEESNLHRNPALKIKDLAHLAQISPRYVSATLNNQLEQSFYEFVNSYRVKEVVEKLRNPESDAFSLEGLAQEAGFNSMSAFYKAFRRQTGMTPGKFRKNLDRN